MSSVFSDVAHWTAGQCGRAHTFILACLCVVVWGLTGPLFHYSDTWQLVINTGTTIVTFLMVFLMQNTQNRDTAAIQLKLDELIRANENARNAMLTLEDLTEEQLKRMKATFARLAERPGAARGQVARSTGRSAGGEREGRGGKGYDHRHQSQRQDRHGQRLTSWRRLVMQPAVGLSPPVDDVGGGMSSTITRRRATVGVAAALGGATLVARHAHADEAAMLDAARKEGTLTWYIAQVDGETAELMGRAFTAHYPGVKVSVIRTTGQVAYERLMQDLKNNAPQCDVFSTTDISHMPALRKRNEIANFVPDNAAAMAPAFHGLGEDGYFYPTTSTLMLIIYNTQKLKPEEAPRNWPDLLDPKFKGRRRVRPSGVLRLCRLLDAGDAHALRLAVLRQAGEEQSAHRPLWQRSDHAAERRRVRGGTGTARHHVAVGGEGQSDRAAISQPMGRCCASARPR